MTSLAIETQGTKLYVSDAGSPQSYTQVKELVSFTAFDGEAAEIDITNLDSTAKERLMGLQDWGRLSGEFNYVRGDAGQAIMLTAKRDRTKRAFKFQLSDDYYYEFEGFVMNAPISGGVDAKTDRSFSILITGDVAGPYLGS
jgi:hypothetical protein